MLTHNFHLVKHTFLILGAYIYENKDVRNRGYFLKLKGVRKQKYLENTVLDELENQDFSAPKISRRHANV